MSVQTWLCSMIALAALPTVKEGGAVTMFSGRVAHREPGIFAALRSKASCYGDRGAGKYLSAPLPIL